MRDRSSTGRTRSSSRLARRGPPVPRDVGGDIAGDGAFSCRFLGPELRDPIFAPDLHVLRPPAASLGDVRSRPTAGPAVLDPPEVAGDQPTEGDDIALRDPSVQGFSGGLGLGRHVAVATGKDGGLIPPGGTEGRPPSSVVSR
jgi:hypothetical protein